MLVAQALTRVPWRPDFSRSGLDSPHWTRVGCGDAQLSNAIDSVDWNADPVQVELCELCGATGCATGGYVHISRLGGHVLWTAPRFDRIARWNEADARGQFAAVDAVRRRGSVAIPIAVWDDLRISLPSVPDAKTLAPATRWDIRQAWLLEAHPGDHAASDIDALLSRDLLAVDHGELRDAAATVKRLCAWLDVAPDAAIDGELTPLGGAHLVTLYLGAPDRRWPAIARIDGEPCLAFGGELVLQPAPKSETQRS
jgi:hypothetical protein